MAARSFKWASVQRINWTFNRFTDFLQDWGASALRLDLSFLSTPNRPMKYFYCIKQNNEVLLLHYMQLWWDLNCRLNREQQKNCSQTVTVYWRCLQIFDERQREYFYFYMYFNRFQYFYWNRVFLHKSVFHVLKRLNSAWLHRKSAFLFDPFCLFTLSRSAASASVAQKLRITRCSKSFNRLNISFRHNHHSRT